ncbi:MAG: S-layer family protein [Sphaerospermopsis sp. SIO1G2]|nr:S-layer family protein [Sphaerospermopsis sp. SIO1G2]
MTGASEINVSSPDDAGFFSLTANNVSLAQESKIVANARLGIGGHVQLLELTSLQLTDNSEISASTIDGEAGDLTIDASEFVTLASGSLLASDATGTGKAGFIEIKTKNFSMESADVNVNSRDQNAGNLTMFAETVVLDQESKIEGNSLSAIGGNIELLELQSLQLNNNSEISALTTSGEAGDITVNAESILVDTNSVISSASAGNGLAGNVTLNASNFINLDNNSRVTSNASVNGDAGSVQITTGELTMTGASEINVNSPDDAGFFSLTANNVILDQASKIAANARLGVGGDVQLLELTSLQLTDNSEISASTIDGEAGDLRIEASEFITLASDSFLASEATGTGKAGSVEITTQNLSMQNASINISSINKRAGNLTLVGETVVINQESKIAANSIFDFGGNLEFSGLQSLQLNNNSEISAFTASGEAGDITINSESILVDTNSVISSSASGNGLAGNITFNANNFINLDNNSRVTSNASSSGLGGSINVNADTLNIKNSADINANSRDNLAGDIDINARIVSLDQNAKIEATTFSGNGGSIQFQGLTSLNLSNQSIISSNTINGSSGDIDIQVSGAINLDSRSILASAANGEGDAGKIDIIAGEVNLSDGSRITVSSQDNVGGNLTLTANTVILDQQAQINGETLSGVGGNIQLQELTSLQLSNDSFISASTINGDAGDVIINAQDFVNLNSGSGIASQATGDGSAGFIEITTSQFTVSNQGTVNVSSPLAEAGFLNITTNNLFLDQGTLLAETGAGETGENAIINLFLRDLLWMRNNSQISAQAFNTAQGGNINIDASNGFLVVFPFENSDINANANLGDGGIIDITTQNIFGIEFRTANTPKSDITASSRFGVNGEVNIDTVDVDPAQGILSLPTNLLDISNQIAKECDFDDQVASQNNEFIIIGRGGLPYTPQDLFTGANSLVDLVEISPHQNNQGNVNNSPNVRYTNPAQKIVEAQGWLVDDQGAVHLVANVDKIHPQKPILNPNVCSAN